MKTTGIRIAAAAVLLLALTPSSAAPPRVGSTTLTPWTQQGGNNLPQMEERVKTASGAAAITTPISRTSRKASLDQSATVATVVDDGTRIVTNIINWFAGDFLGVGQLRPMAGAWPEKVFASADSQNLTGSGGVVIANGKLYKCKYGSAMGQVYTAAFYAYDMETGELLTSAELPGQWYSIWENGAYNPVNGKIYVLGYDGMARAYISELNVETGVYTQLVQCSASIMSMAFDAEGNLYSISGNGELERIDITTGVATPLFRIEPQGVGLHYWHSIAFDYHTGELFWFRTDEGFNTSLNLIDIPNEKVEYISVMPSHFGTNYSYVVSPEAPAGAPESVQAITVDLSGTDGMHGDVNVTAPATTFGGESLSGEMTLTIYVDNEKAGTVTALPGATTTLKGCSFIGAGEHNVAAVATNAAGDGPRGSVTVYCGSDVPTAPTDITLAVNTSGQSSLSWTAPTVGIHDTPLDASQLTYDVVRYPDGERVATGITATTFTNQLPSGLNRWSYGVTAHCSGLDSEEGVSNSVVFGEGMSLPIDVALGDETFFNLCEVFDIDGDGNSFYQTWGSASAYSVYADTPYASNDWLITPPVTLRKGNYRYEMTYMAAGDPVNADLTMGLGATPEAQTTVLHEIRNLLYQDGVTTTRMYVSIPEDGTYYFGINFTSVTPVAGDLSMPYGSFQRLVLYEGPADDAPAEVANLCGTPFPKGELKTTLTFTAPTNTYAGNPLASLSRIEVCRADDTPIGEITDVLPGQTCTFIDENAAQGDNIYRIYSYNEAGRGKVVELTVFAGQDVPGLITSLNYKIENNRVLTFEWGAPTSVGVNGGYCDPSEFTYDFCRSQYSTQMPTAVVGGTGLTERRFTYTECGPDSYYGAIQHQYLYGIQAVNSRGPGALGYLGVMCGDPFAAPFTESFAGGANTNVGWSSQVLDGEQAWSVSTGDTSLGIAPVDNDGGMLLFSHPSDVQTGAAVISPFLALERMANPVLEFSLWHNADAPREAYLSVQASRDNGVYIPVETLAAGGTSGWRTHRMSLADFNGSDRVFIAFLGVNNTAADYFALDAIRVYDDVAHDLSAETIAAPASLAMDEEAEVNISVRNMGLEAAGAFLVEILADGVVIASEESAALPVGGSRVVSVHVTPDAVMARRDVELKGRVVLEGDENSANDETDAVTATVGGSLLPAPTNLTATPAGSDITLTWDAPQTPLSEDAEEGFEDYEPFAITSQGDWTFVDRDRLAPCGIGGLTYPNMSEGRAFMVWNVTDLKFGDRAAWSPLTGNQCLIAFASDAYTVGGTYDGTCKSDEWLISPHIAGGSELRFHASAPAGGSVEHFEVLVSYGTRNPEDFASLSGDVKVTESGWKEYVYTLPMDAEYFAIRYTSDGHEAFALMFDDISYRRGYNEVEFLGYNVYADGALQNATPLTAESHTLSDTATAYGVSALYAEGESEMATVGSPSGVSAVGAEGIRVFSESGNLTVEAPAGLLLTVWTTAGECQARRTTTGNDRVSLPSGVYIVCVGTATYKVLVK